MPSTSQPSVGDFLAVYEPLLDGGADIVSIHLSAGISGTFTAAEQATSSSSAGSTRRGWWCSAPPPRARGSA